MTKARGIGKAKRVLALSGNLVNPLLLSRDFPLRMSRDWITINRIAIQKDYRFIYLRIPKVANSTILQLLFKQAMRNPSVTQSKDYITRKWMTDLASLSWATGLRARQGYFTFMFVRNPYSRVLSAFSNKLFQNSFYITKFGPKVRALSDFGNIDFTGFCRFLDKGGLYRDAHWAPQVSFAWPSVRRIDFVGRLERLDDGLRHVFNVIYGCSDVLDELDLSGFRSGPRATDAEKRIQREYSDEALEIVSRLYDRDFRAFGYEKHDGTGL